MITDQAAESLELDEHLADVLAREELQEGGRRLLETKVGEPSS
jgi:hypothetical protein